MVEVVEEHVVEAADAGLDVAWYSDVENAERSIATAGDRRPNAVQRDDGARCGRRTEQHVDFVQRGPTLVVMHRDRAVTRRKLPCSLICAIGDDRGAYALGAQALERKFRHFTRAEDHRAASGE